VTFNDLARGQGSGPLANRNPVELKLNRCGDPEFGPNFTKIVGLPLAPILFTPTLAGDELCPWRGLEVRVTPETIQFRWENEWSGVLPRPAVTDDARRLAWSEEYPLDIPPEFAPRGALGLFVCRGAAFFQKVVVEPFPAR
jgi:hypothetical protein